MRQGQQNRRGRGRNNNNNNRGKGQHQNPLTRSFESNGPDVKIRGTPAHIAEKYMSLARDAQSSGDPVLAENYLQHAEHYNRIIMAYREQLMQHGDTANGGGRHRPSFGDTSDIGDDMDDDGDDMGADVPHVGGQQLRGHEPQPRMFDSPGQNRSDEQPSQSGGFREQREFRDHREHRDQRDHRDNRQFRHGGDRGQHRGPQRERYGEQRSYNPDRQQYTDRMPHHSQPQQQQPMPQEQRIDSPVEPRAERQPRPEAYEERHREERPERVARPERAERPERQPRIDRPERPDRPVRVDRPERMDRPERVERSADRAPRRREQFGESQDQPDFLKRPVRPRRRETAVDEGAEAEASPVAETGVEKQA